jgi:hypothetical protein
MLTITIPAFVCLAGLLVYGFAANPKLQEVGRIAYQVGLFFVVWTLAGRKL